MHFIRSIDQCLAPDLQARLGAKTFVGVTIGNFDGMHLGHQALFHALHNRLAAVAQAKELSATSVMMTFSPHPQLVLADRPKEEFDADPRFWLITPLLEKIELARVFGFDYLFRAKFTRAFSQLSPKEFVEQYIVQALHAQLVVVGHDWSFACGKQGGSFELAELGKQFGYETLVVPPVLCDEERVSSSTVRDALAQGRLEQLEKLLGRPFEISGRVQHGEKRGRALGFPTANLLQKRQLLPRDGVYASLAIVDGRNFPAVTNIGVRPTFNSEKKRVIETHILDRRSLDLYRKRLIVRFVAYLRPEEKFCRSYGTGRANPPRH